MNNSFPLASLGFSVPPVLKSTQEWFAGVITNPLENNERIQTFSPYGTLIAEESARYIIPSPTLKPHRRIEIYNQQYWWRLLNTLHQNFPILTRMFGYQAFNQKIGVPFLSVYPPDHWSLTVLGERLPAWISESYQDKDRSLLHNAAALDWAFTASYIAPESPPLDLSLLLTKDPESLLECTFYLQPSIRIFAWNYDLLTFRQTFLSKEVDYWLENSFPELATDKLYRFVLFRDKNNRVAWKQISEGESILLELFREGSSLEKACEILQKQEESIYDEIEANLQQWMQEWARSGWLTLQAPQNGILYPYHRKGFFRFDKPSKRL